ncbi:MAG: hypothetical protein Q6K35_06625, partial [Thermostichus sp. DG02_4_bins_136]
VNYPTLSLRYSAGFIPILDCNRAAKFRNFGLIYNNNPKERNYLSSVLIRIPLKPAMATLKHLTIPVRLTLFRGDVQTFVAPLGPVGGGNPYQRHTSNSGLVFHKNPQLVKRPAICSAPFRSASAFLV